MGQERSISTRFKLIEGSQGSAFNTVVGDALEAIEDIGGDAVRVDYGSDRGKHHAGIQYTVPVGTPRNLLDLDALNVGSASPMHTCETSDPKGMRDARNEDAPAEVEIDPDAPEGTHLNPKRIAAS